MNEIKRIDDWLDTAQRICTNTDGKTKYEFNNFTFTSKFTSKMYRHDLMLQEAEDDQQELEILINKLNNNCNPKNQTKIKEKDDVLKSARKLFSIREEIIRAFKKGVFPYKDRFQVEKESDEESDEESALGNENIDAADMSDLEGEESAVERRNQQP